MSSASARIYRLNPAKTPVWGREESSLDLAVLDDLEEYATVPVESYTKVDEGEDLEQLIDELRALTDTTVASSTRTVTVRVPTRYLELHNAVTDAMEKGASIALRRPNDIPLHSLLRFSAVLCFVICGGTFAMWLGDLPPLVNPFAALLGSVASPFFYWMGEAARLRPH